MIALSDTVFIFIHLPRVFLATDILFEQRIGDVTEIHLMKDMLFLLMSFAAIQMKSLNLLAILFTSLKGFVHYHLFLCFINNFC